MAQRPRATTLARARLKPWPPVAPRWPARLGCRLTALNLTRSTGGLGVPLLVRASCTASKPRGGAAVGCRVAGHGTEDECRRPGRRAHVWSASGRASLQTAGRRSMWIRHSPHSETPSHPRRSACRDAVGRPTVRRSAPGRARCRQSHSPPGLGARLPAVVGVCAKSIRCSIG